MSTLFGADLPRPAVGTLTIFLLGPGIGESVVAVMPDRKVMVMDVCVKGGTNLTLALLEALEISAIDLLVISHPDLDHVRGLAQVLTSAPPTELWRYPLEARAREFALAWAKRRKNTPLAAALHALGLFLRKGDGDAFPACYGDRTWPHGPPSQYVVHALAPTTYDQDRAVRAWDHLLARDRASLERWLDRVAANTRAVGDAPNVVSVAVAIEFGERRILLGGDVLRGTRSPKSGWKGILRLLQRHQRLHQVEALAAVKVAHHGSHGAFEPEAWQLHSDGARAGEPVALIAPFTPSSLPDEPTLAALRAHAPAILITRCGAVTHSRMAHVGWSAGPMDVLSATRAPCVGLSIDASGELRTFVSSTAAGFVYGWPSAEFASRR